MLKRIIVILVVLACAAGGIWWLYDGKRQPSDLLTLYGNVDIRQVDVGFRVGGRVTELFKEEGDAVKTGERLARLDAKPYEEVFDQAAAQLSMQEIELRKMVAGYRTEDIEQARATLSGAQAVYANAASNLRRVERLRQQNAVSQQSLDEARASYGDALSRRNAAREQLQLMESGYRSEDVERQKAAVEAARSDGISQIALAALPEQAETVLNRRYRETGKARVFTITESALRELLGSTAPYAPPDLPFYTSEGSVLDVPPLKTP